MKPAAQNLQAVSILKPQLFGGHETFIVSYAAGQEDAAVQQLAKWAMNAELSLTPMEANVMAAALRARQVRRMAGG